MSEERQIKSMIDFIEREAREKADEIDQLAQEDYDIERMRLVETEKAKIRATLEKKKKKAETDARVERANLVKQQRMRVMEQRALIVEQLRKVIRGQIAQLVKDGKRYKPLLQSLMTQSLAALRADAIVMCRKEDEGVVKSLLKEVAAAHQNAGNPSVTLTVGTDYLNDESSWGGVVLRSVDGQITCNNTLKNRLELVYEGQTPAIRYFLFNEQSTL